MEVDVTMKITVKLFAMYRTKITGAENGEICLELYDPADVGQIIDQLNLPHGSSNIIINGKAAGEDTLLTPGDKVSLFPYISGG